MPKSGRTKSEENLLAGTGGPVWYVAQAVPPLVTYFEPAIPPEAWPSPMPSPFASVPHALAQRAARTVASDLRAEGPSSQHNFEEAGGGKMFGVLVVVDGKQQVGFLRAVSGMLGGTWAVPGFVPPLFDVEARDAFWPEGQEALRSLEEKLQELIHGEDAVERVAEASALAELHAGRELELRERLENERKLRAQARETLLGMASGKPREDALQVLAEQSRAGRRLGKRMRKEHRLAMEPHEQERQRAEARRLALKEDRRQLSNGLLRQIQDGYKISNGHGERVRLASIYAPQVPPGGSGDCAAPKLLGYAHQEGLRPLALAEFWWGASPAGGGRHAEHFYPPCKSKCGPLLPFLLEGVAHETAPLYATETISAEEPICVYEDESLVVVDKPSGMLSVPGAHAKLHDSALERLRTRYPRADGPLLVHRLDLDTSGLLVMAKTLDVYRTLQAFFAKRKIEKHYLAWVDGKVESEDGEISLALRVDLEDRPRQIYDPIHGKAAVTRYRVLERRETPQGCFTKVSFQPRTGRTHQLRVHAAHQKGLGAPIVGDRLYGKGHGRLLLHATSLRFPHPRSGEMVEFQCPLPPALAAPDFDSIHLRI